MELRLRLWRPSHGRPKMHVAICALTIWTAWSCPGFGLEEVNELVFGSALYSHKVKAIIEWLEQLGYNSSIEQLKEGYVAGEKFSIFRIDGNGGCGHGECIYVILDKDNRLKLITSSEILFAQSNHVVTLMFHNRCARVRLVMEDGKFESESVTETCGGRK